MGEDYTEATYGDRGRGDLRQRHLDRFEEDTAKAVAILKELAGAGPALELGIGTGRWRSPRRHRRLGTRDRRVGTDGRSVAKLGGLDIDLTRGSFADFSLDARFPLIYVVFNTFFGLLTQSEQVSCFEAVARHLTPDGAFAIQAFVRDVTRFDAHNQRVATETIGLDQVTLETSSHDPFTQRTDSRYVVIRDGSVRVHPVRIRYAYPSELDLMARIGGLRLRERWSDWDRAPFPSTAWQHISVWEPAADGPRS